MRKLRVLDLFSGIGGFSLGLERTGGFETVAFCEIEEYPRKVLNKHWPKVPIYHDVRNLTADALRRDGIAVDVICGGFPCQDISFAGKGAGLAGERSGLWRDYARLVGELRPRFVIVENVSALLGRGLGTVLGDLASLGYDAEWHCIPASAVGAPHRRDRLWLVAYPGGQQYEGDSTAIGRALAAQLHAADAYGESEHDGTFDAEVGGASELDTYAATVLRPEIERSEPHRDHPSTGAMADPSCQQRQRARLGSQGRSKFANGSALADANSGNGHGRGGNVQVGRKRRKGKTSNDGDAARTQWCFEPDVGRVANGVPSRVDRLRGLGNAVVPQIPELIGRAILQAEGLTPWP